MFGLFSQYPTVMVFLAVVIAAFCVLAFMPGYIQALKRKKVGQQVRDDGPETHLVKQGTPTMGGLIMLLAVVASVLLVDGFTVNAFLLVGVTFLTGAIGFVDDFAKVANARSLGLTPPQKLALQFPIATVLCLVAVNVLGIEPTVEIPFVCTIDLGIINPVLPIAGGIAIPILYLVYVNLLVIGLSNATNLTDGLDGLAAGTVMIVMIVMAAIAYRLNMLDVSVFAAAMAGACVGFLWFNSHPADIFMGDTGSLALGAALGAIAVLTKTEFVVLIIGLLFVLEALSVMIQVAYFKKTRKRIFLMAPLHHHFEKKGWSETKVVVRFWIISGVFAAVGFLLFFVGTMAW